MYLHPLIVVAYTTKHIDVHLGRNYVITSPLIAQLLSFIILCAERIDTKPSCNYACSKTRNYVQARKCNYGFIS